MIFLYKGLNKERNETVGYINADSRMEALNKLKDTTDLVTIHYCEEKLDIPFLNNLRLKFINFPSNLSYRRKARESKDAKDKQNLFQTFKDDMEERGKKRAAKKEAKKIAKEARNKNRLRIRDIRSFKDLKKFMSQDINIGSQPVEGEATIARSVDINWDLIEGKAETDEMKANKSLRVSRREIIVFTRRMNMMLSSGISISRSLDILSEHPNKDMVKIVEGIIKDINEGVAFSDALMKYPKQFDSTYIAMITIGEDSGNLPDVLTEIADYMERGEVVKGKLTTASIYPAIIATILLVTLLLGSIFFIPAFKDMFDGQETALPSFTRAVFRISDLMPYIILAIGGTVLLIMFLRRHIVKFDRFIRSLTDKLKIKLFILKDILNCAYMYNISSTIHIMLSSGIRLKDTINLTRETISNIYIQSDLVDVSSLMVEGYSFSESLEQQATIDPLFTSIVLTGEETGDLDRALFEVSQYYNYELNRLVDNAMEIIQPLLMVVVGLIAIPVIIAIYLPIFDISTGKML